MGQVRFNNYSPVADLTVISICLVLMILIFFSYNRKSRSFKIFLVIVGMLVGAAYADVVFYALAGTGRPSMINIAYGVRCLYHALLFMVFIHYVIYIAEVTNLTPRQKRPYVSLAVAIFVVIVTIDILDTFRGNAVRVTQNSLSYNRRDPFMWGYLAFVALIVVMLAKVRKRLYRRVMLSFYGTMAVSFGILLLQGIHGQSSFTVATFLYPIIAMFYIMHSNPYDAQLGAIDSRAMADFVAYNHAKQRDFVFLSLYLRDFDEEGKALPASLQATIRRFAAGFFKGATLFQAGPGHVVLVLLKRRNPDYEEQTRRILEAFQVEYKRFGYDYKIVIGESIDEISRKNEYVSFIQNVHRYMEPNTIHFIDADDVTKFNLYDYILGQLEDIRDKRDLDDPRVLAYCQPVYNIKTRRYDTAEALMRLRLDGAGMVFPDQFIPLAEENGMIHVLTEIILHKTCEAVRSLIAEGYSLTRVSVNVSAMELKDDSFCQDVIGIIDRSQIPGEKIAIELTESRNESDFILMKHKIGELRERGITFYLDDFGTGYSSMERIMELPFDIIKFDRSMVIASGASERSRRIVIGLANLFSQLHYSVLYEGVEKDSDEQMCIDMSAAYLQGYKYSRPVPIEELRRYLDAKAG